MTVKIKLNIDQYNMLNEVLSLSDKIVSGFNLKQLNINYDSLKNNIKFLKERNMYFVSGKVDDLSDLREVVSDYLVYCGFNKNYEPNEKGIILENLIDILNINRSN